MFDDGGPGFGPVSKSLGLTKSCALAWVVVNPNYKEFLGIGPPPRGLLLAPGGSSRRMRLSPSAESCVYFSLVDLTVFS